MLIFNYIQPNDLRVIAHNRFIRTPKVNVALAALARHVKAIDGFRDDSSFLETRHVHFTLILAALEPLPQPKVAISVRLQPLRFLHNRKFKLIHATNGNLRQADPISTEEPLIVRPVQVSDLMDIRRAPRPLKRVRFIEIINWPSFTTVAAE